MKAKRDNMFRTDEVYELMDAKVIRSKQQIGKKGRKRLVVDIELGVGSTTIEDVPYYGGGIDIITGFPHGIFIPPREEQLVGVLFLRGHHQNPVSCFPIPHPAFNIKQEDLEKYDEIMENIDDIALFHFSGSRIFLREDGTIELTKDISGTEYKLSFSFSDTKKTFAITDLNSNNIITLNEDGMVIKDKNNNEVKMNSTGIEVIGKGGTIIKAAARKDDEIQTTATTDTVFEIWRLSFNTWAAGLGMPNPMPATRTGKITKASDEVKISGVST